MQYGELTPYTKTNKEKESNIHFVFLILTTPLKNQIVDMEKIFLLKISNEINEKGIRPFYNEMK
jgi:hypothetical protein